MVNKTVWGKIICEDGNTLKVILTLVQQCGGARSRCDSPVLCFISLATTMESQLLIQSEAQAHVTQSRTYSEHTSSSTHSTHSTQSHTKQHRKKSMRKNKDENPISVSKSSEKLSKKLKAEEVEPNCAACSKPVFVMERVKAEKRVFHKECFRCIECNKQLTVETYQSNQTHLYCKQHFKSLFAPKAVEGEEEESNTPKKHQVIICESNPKELPPDVVRASDKPDLGLEELSTLDVKSRFQMFENKSKTPEEPPPLEQHTQRDKSSALLSRLAKFKAKGMDIGVSDEYLNGIPIEPSSSEGEEEDEDSVLKKSYKHTGTREQPVSFCNMSEIVGRFESGDHDSAERRQERKQEIQNIRSRLFMGKQAKIKEMYEQSVMQSEQAITSADKIARDLDLDNERARSIKQKFENGEIFQEDRRKEPRNKDIEDETLFNAGIGKQSRTIFLEMDANNANSGPVSPPATIEPPRRKEKPFIPKDVIRAADKVDDVRVETADISNKFQFFETYRPKEERRQFRMTPPREGQTRKSPSPELYRDPDVVRSDEVDAVADTGLAQQRHTASRMIDVFKKMELEQSKKEEPLGPKPLKSFTPPLPGADYRTRDSSEDEYSEEEEDSEDERQRAYLATRERDEALQQAQALARAKNLRNRFEHWSETEQVPRSPSAVIIERQPSLVDDEESQIETAKSLRAKFENLKSSSNVVKTFAAPKVNRFV